MKVLVDEMPTKPQDCLFSEYFEDGDFNCKLESFDYCKFCYGKGKKCDKLATFDKKCKTGFLIGGK